MASRAPSRRTSTTPDDTGKIVYSCSVQEPESKPPSSMRVDAAELLGALHDVSNALTVILGWVGAAQASGTPRDLVDDALSVIERRARMARDMAREALGAEGIEVDGRARMQAIDGIVAELLKALAQEAARARVRLQVERRGPNLTILQAAAASQVLTNLLLNAIAFSPEGGTVLLDVDTSFRVARFRVSDDGPGVPEARRATIFSGGVSTRAGGAGVGLRHANALARSCGGELALADRGPGAHFELTWPCMQGTPVPVRPSLRRLPLFAGRTFVVCDDDRDVADLLSTGLEARGAEVFTAADAAALLQVLRDQPQVDAVLLDRSPIARDLAPVGEAIGQHRSRPPVLAITGSTEGFGDAFASLRTAFLRKPFEMGDVVEGLALVLGGSADERVSK
jgi:CheY-like chemotaxis protein